VALEYRIRINTLLHLQQPRVIVAEETLLPVRFKPVILI
jgi:hypothetical protein